MTAFAQAQVVGNTWGPIYYYNIGGDPAYGCVKNLDITYNCGSSAPQKLTVPGEAGLGGMATFACPATHWHSRCSWHLFPASHWTGCGFAATARRTRACTGGPPAKKHASVRG